MMRRPCWLPLLLLLLISCCSFSITQALVPLSKTFKYVNQGELQSILAENDAAFRPIPNIRNHPFELCFYSTTPANNAFTLALSMGFLLTDYGLVPRRRWVWEASPDRPVGENATLTFGRDGNLVLADAANGRVAWQTRTANKGVVDLKLLPNGNLVLLDEHGGFVWQSFHYPTDTLLNGQGLRADGVNKLVSGSYSMVLVNRSYISLYFKSKYSQKPLSYNIIEFPSEYGSFKNVSFVVSPPDNITGGIDRRDTANQLGLAYVANAVGMEVWTQPKYNSTLSMLRLGPDGNLHVYTYSEKGVGLAWEETYTYFSRDSFFGSECMLPEKCGALGVCDNNQCVACPTSKGLMGWSLNCQPEKLPSCNKTSATNKLINFNDYYKIERVTHTLNNDGAIYQSMTIDQCRKKCSEDCKCVAFFYKTIQSSCFIANELYTLRVVYAEMEADVVAYIKYAK